MKSICDAFSHNYNLPSLHHSKQVYSIIDKDYYDFKFMLKINHLTTGYDYSVYKDEEIERNNKNENPLADYSNKLMLMSLLSRRGLLSNAQIQLFKKPCIRDCYLTPSALNNETKIQSESAASEDAHGKHTHQLRSLLLSFYN